MCQTCRVVCFSKVYSAKIECTQNDESKSRFDTQIRHKYQNDKYSGNTSRGGDLTHVTSKQVSRYSTHGEDKVR